jgi:hypothetical protein
LETPHDPEHPVVKAVVAWIGVGLSYLGIHQWSDLAAIMASIYTAWLIAEKAWSVWKRHQDRHSDRH